MSEILTASLRNGSAISIAYQHVGQYKSLHQRPGLEAMKTRRLDTSPSKLDRARRAEANNQLWETATMDVQPLKRSQTMVPAVKPTKPLGRPPDPPSSRIDLHGLTIAQAHAHVRRCLDEGPSRLTVITGRSGAIRHEFPSWLDDRRIRRIEELPGGGAYRLYLHRRDR